MKRRIALLSGAGLSLAAATTAHSQGSARSGKVQVVIQVSTPELRLWNHPTSVSTLACGLWIRLNC